MRMNSMVFIGLILIVLGIVALAYQGITYSSRETIVDVGPVQATAEKEQTIPLPPIIGGVALAGGLLLVFVGGRKASVHEKL